jgi:SAM-dependent methyltransferase
MSRSVGAAAAPGGWSIDVAKRVAERVLWSRVTLQRRLHRNAPGKPAVQEPTAVLRKRAEWQEAVAEARRRRLPLHHDRPKNWDALGALSVVLETARRDEAVLDAGSARYSSVLPWLRLYSYTKLLGLNLEFGEPTFRDGVEFRYGDITATDLPDASLAAITCMSVVEHGVPVEAFLRESARLLRRGGVLVLSTDYDSEPPDTSDKLAYGQPVHIFGPDEIRSLIDTAGSAGLRLRGEFRPEHEERPVHWKRQGLDYTFVRLTFEKA